MNIMSFCLETKERKIQDLETSAKNLKVSLKFPKLARIDICSSVQ